MYNGSHYARTFKGEKHPSQPKPRLTSATRHNNPHPEGVGFLMQDVATLHDPICDVKTKVNPNDAHWWPSRENPNTNKNPVYTKDTINRSDFKTYKDRPKGQTRHGSNPHTVPAQGPGKSSAFIPSPPFSPFILNPIWHFLWAHHVRFFLHCAPTSYKICL